MALAQESNHDKSGQLTACPWTVMLRAIAAAKKKNDRIDANKICDCLRCDFFPECYMA
jgi:hypothetical protein